MSKPKSDHGVDLYAERVHEREIIAGPLVRLAADRHLTERRLSLRKSGHPCGFWFDEAAANHIIEFFEQVLRLPDTLDADGEPIPFLLTPANTFIVGSIFGWKIRPSMGGWRRYREAYIEMGKGNAKTIIAAGIGLYGLTMDGEQAAEIYSAATGMEQAKICWIDAQRMVDASPELSAIIYQSQNNLAYEPTMSFFRPISNEKRSKSGPRPHMALIDELHEAADSVIVNKLRAGAKRRTQPLFFEITNALALDTQIPTPSGWTTMRDIRIGATIFDENGRPCQVVAATPVMKGHDCFDLLFDDHSSIVADAGHFWKTRQISSGRSHSQAISQRRREKGRLLPCAAGSAWQEQRTGIRTTRDLYETRNHGKQSNHSIDICKALEIEHRNLPVHPYVFGCWLGDGNSKDGAMVVTDEDSEILAQIRSCGVTVGTRRPVSSSKRLGLYSLGVTGKGRSDSFCAELRRMGVLNNKHIPSEFLRASIDQRLSLLQGLMDTDGHIIPRSGRCVFTQSRRELIAQAQELIQSLGIKSFLRHDVSVLREKKFDRWDLSFAPPWGLRIFRLTRKQQHNTAKHSRRRMSQQYAVVDVRPIDSVPVRCISVDSPSRLFLVGRSMIPTHNSGFDRTSICWQHHEHSRKILEGIVEDDRWFPYVCSLDEQDDPLAEKSCHVKANPNLGTIIQQEYLDRQVANAKNIPAETNTVLRLNFCIWTQAHSAFFDRGRWDGCQVASDAEFVGMPCYGGLDLGQSDDFTAWVRIWLLDGDRVGVRCRFWVPRSALAKYPERPYAQWERAGVLTVTEGDTTDLDLVEQTVIDDCRESGVLQLAYDKRFASQMALHIQGAGITCVDTPQGYFLNEAIRKVSAWVVNGELCHNANPILGWMADNVVVLTGRMGEYRLDKQRSKEKIDGISALVMAASRVLEEKPTSVYLERGVRTLGT